MEFINRVNSPMNLYVEDSLDTKEELDAARLKIIKQQKKSAPFLIGTIGKVNDRITSLEDELRDLDTGLVIESRLSNTEDDYPPLSPRFEDGPKGAKDVKELNQFAGVYAVKSMLQGDKGDKAKYLMKEFAASRKQQKEKTGSKPRLVELHQYPGYEPDRLTQLPEVPGIVILKKVTDAQLDLGRKPHYRIEFRRLFHSKMSEAILLDTFWYFFLHRYHPSKTVQSRLFNRISYNYVKLILSAKQPKYREVFFKSYADSLAQAVYSAYCMTFPNSWRQFDDNFKEDLCRLTSEWVVGTRQAPRLWNLWNFSGLEPMDMKKDDFTKKDKKKGGILNFQSSASDSSQILPDIGGHRSMVVDDDASMISTVAEAQSTSTMSSSHANERGSRRQSNTDGNRRRSSTDVGKKAINGEACKSQSRHAALQTISEQSSKGLIGAGRGAGMDGKGRGGKTVGRKKQDCRRVPAKGSEGRLQPQGGAKSNSDLVGKHTLSQISIKHKSEKKESHPATEGPSFIKHMFNVGGRSPLVAHFMRQHKLENKAGTTILLQRTEIDKLPSATAPTYQDIIQDSFHSVRHMKNTYQQMYEEGLRQHTHFLTEQRAHLHEHMRRENALMSHPREVKKLSDLLILELLKDQGEVSTGAAQAVEEAMQYYANLD